MGGVRRVDDEESAIYGTVGYQAPEIATLGPSPSSDLYTVGRALAVLTFPFTGYQRQYEHSLPDSSTVAVLRDNDSFRRAVQRATNPDPDRRFGSAAEMAEQLTGVLREVLSVADGQPRPAFSSLFSGEVQTIGVPPVQYAGAWTDHPSAAEIVTGLPVPAVERTDPAAGFLATLGALDSAQSLTALSAAAAGEEGTPAGVASSDEIRYALIRALIVGGDLEGAGTSLAGDVPDADWRTDWYGGLLAFSRGDAAEARKAFDRVLSVLPGELPPKLALALAEEAAGDLGRAQRLFETVWQVDHSFVSAAFGLARVKLASGDHAGAVEALNAVPEMSSLHVPAQVAAIRVLLSCASGDPPAPAAAAGGAEVGAEDLSAAAAALGRLDLDPMLRQRLTVEILGTALDRIFAGQSVPPGLLGTEPRERSLRSGLEDSLRAQARMAADATARIRLVDLANEVRPRTWS